MFPKSLFNGESYSAHEKIIGKLFRSIRTCFGSHFAAFATFRYFDVLFRTWQKFYKVLVNRAMTIRFVVSLRIFSIQSRYIDVNISHFDIPGAICQNRTFTYQIYKISIQYQLSRLVSLDSPQLQLSENVQLCHVRMNE